MKAAILVVDSVRQHHDSDGLNINTLGPVTIVSNKEDGVPRYMPGKLVLHLPPDTIVPEWLLRHGYWDEEKGKGILGGNKKNRVTARNFAGVVSDGIIIPIQGEDGDWYLMSGDDKITITTTEAMNLEEVLGISYRVPS